MDKETVERVRKEAEQAYLELANLRGQVKIAEDKYFKLSKRFQDFDHQLALVDGRLKKIPEHTKKEKKPAVLTLEQIQNIAEILGIKIEDEDSEEKGEEKDE